MRKINVTLVAKVHYVRGTGKVATVTGVTIELAPLGIQVATANLGGRYTPEQALAEYRKNPGRFRLLPGAEVAKAAA